MNGVEVMADRYAKFRKLGEFTEFKVKGGRANAAREERKKVWPARPCVVDSFWASVKDGRTPAAWKKRRKLCAVRQTPSPCLVRKQG